jgi:Xaa-Pro aminopeptidase
MVTLLSNTAYVVEKHTPQIVAAGKHTSEVHYYPAQKNFKIIKKNGLIMLDIWARLKGNNSPFADITWMGYAGKNAPKDILKTFNSETDCYVTKDYKLVVTTKVQKEIVRI